MTVDLIFERYRTIRSFLWNSPPLPPWAQVIYYKLNNSYILYINSKIITITSHYGHHHPHQYDHHQDHKEKTDCVLHPSEGQERVRRCETCSSRPPCWYHQGRERICQQNYNIIRTTTNIIANSFTNIRRRKEIAQSLLATSMLD